MKIEIEVISTITIPPSSPTPNDVSNYKLSFLDQMHAPVLMPLTFFYKATSSLTKSEISSHLRESLSKTLSLYYPLAGRIVDNSHVHCTDEGIKYVEAQGNCKLVDVINEPIPQELEKLVPQNLDDITDFCMVIQATFFSCGGLAIGVAFSHKIGDGWSFILFLNSWAAISRGDAHIKSPIFDGAALFPPRSDLEGFDPRTGMVSKENIITKRFLFTASKINELRDKYTNTTRATRIEALSVFIWTRLIISTQNKHDRTKTFTLLHVVNIRKRVVPPLSDYLFGNFVQPAIAVPPLALCDGDDQDVILEKMRVAIRSIGGEDCVTKINEGRETLNSIKNSLNVEVVPFYFTSLCRFPLSEADFEWGKLVWIGLGSGRRKNVVTFMDSFSGGGIEAWVTLKLEDMANFEADKEFFAYATT